MTSLRLAFLALGVLALAAPVAADESAGFVVRLGRDTTSVERYTRSPNRIEVDQVGRAPRVLRRHVVYEFTNGQITSLTLTATPAGATTPAQTVEAKLGPDSLQMTIRTGNAPPQTPSIALPPRTLVLANATPWPVYEGEIAKLVRSKRDTASFAGYFVGAPSVVRFGLRRLGRDTVALTTDRGDEYRARVDKDGVVLGVAPVSGTQKFSLERVAAPDIDAVAAAFAEREKAGGAFGALSPRDTVRATLGGASLLVDYGRPARRGRKIFGEVVPYGEVWRTGANAATQFRTDKALDFGGTVVPAGFYTLWTLPTDQGWTLIVNSETGQWGTAHKAERDVAKIPMQVSAAGEPVEKFTIQLRDSDDGGLLVLEWDTVRASAAFRVQP